MKFHRRSPLKGKNINIQIHTPSLQASGNFSGADFQSVEGEVYNSTEATQE